MGALISVLLMAVSVVWVGAEASDEMIVALPEEFADMLEALPDALRDGLPERLFSANAQDVARG